MFSICSIQFIANSEGLQKVINAIRKIAANKQ